MGTDIMGTGAEWDKDSSLSKRKEDERRGISKGYGEKLFENTSMGAIMEERKREDLSGKGCTSGTAIARMVGPGVEAG